MILSTKKYGVRTPTGTFNLYVSRHDDNMCFAGVLWYRKTGSWAKSEDVNLDFDLKTFVNDSESAAFDEAVQWIKKELDAEAEIFELEQ